MDNIKGFLIDLDGVLYIEDQVIPGAVETVNWLRQQGYPSWFCPENIFMTRSNPDRSHPIGPSIQSRTCRECW